MAIAKVFVYLACIQYLCATAFEVSMLYDKTTLRQSLYLTVEEVNINESVYAIQESLNKLVVSALRHTLVGVVEIVVVVDKPHGQSLDDKSRQVYKLPTPLLLRVAFYQSLVNIAPHEHQRLLFKVARFAHTLSLQLLHYLLSLFLNLSLCLLRSRYAPHLVKGVHIERQIIEFAFIACQRRIGIAIKLHEAIHEVPHLFI